MILPYNKNLKGCARSLRKNMTDAERTLWSMIRRKAVSFHVKRRLTITLWIFTAPQPHSSSNLMEDNIIRRRVVSRTDGAMMIWRRVG